MPIPPVQFTQPRREPSVLEQVFAQALGGYAQRKLVSEPLMNKQAAIQRGQTMMDYHLGLNQQALAFERQKELLERQEDAERSRIVFEGLEVPGRQQESQEYFLQHQQPDDAVIALIEQLGPQAGVQVDTSKISNRREQESVLDTLNRLAGYRAAERSQRVVDRSGYFLKLAEEAGPVLVVDPETGEQRLATTEERIAFRLGTSGGAEALSLYGDDEETQANVKKYLAKYQEIGPDNFSLGSVAFDPAKFGEVVAAYRKNADQPSSAQFAALAGAAEGLYRLGLWSTDSDVPLDAGYFSKEGRPDPKTVNQLPPLLMRDDMSGRLTGYMLAHDYFPTEQSYRDWVRLHDEFHPVPLNPAAQETMKAVWRANRSALPGDPFSVRQPQRQPTSGAGGTGVSSNAPASQPTINVTTVDRTPKYEVGEAQTRRGQTMQHRGDAYEGIYREAFDGAVTTYATNSKPAELFNVRLGQILDLFSGSPEDVVRKVTGVSPSVAGRIRYGNRTSEEIMGKYILHGSSDRLPDIDALRMVLVNLETAAYEEAYARRKE